MIKPLVRWTIGSVNQQGIDVLHESVYIFSNIYPEFDRVVCYNNIDKDSIKQVKAQLYEQKQEQLDYPLSTHVHTNSIGGMVGSGWKLCPPRIRKNGHELWLDNDIIVVRRIKEIDDWLDKDHQGIISEGKYQIYGTFDRFIRNDVKACAGFFGLPPNYDFHATILNYCRLLKLSYKTLGYYDEQGLTVAIVTNLEECVVVPIHTIRIYEPLDHLTILPSAIHFVGVNRSEYHNAWEDYKNTKML